MGSNIGLFISIILAVLGSIGVFGFSFLKLNIFSAVNKIYYNDCLAFDKSKMDMQDYFIRNKPAGQVELMQTNMPRRVGEPKEVGMPRRNPIFRDENERPLNNSNRLNLRENNAARHSVNRDSELDDQEDNPVARNNFVEKDDGDGGRDEENYDKPNHKNPITRPDYDSLDPHLIRRYDNRGLCDYLLDDIIRSHKLANIFFETTIFCPFYVKIAKLAFDLSLKFGFNALLTTDANLDARIINDQRVSNNTNFRMPFSTQ
jgi:hypothetical protein